MPPIVTEKFSAQVDRIQVGPAEVEAARIPLQVKNPAPTDEYIL